MADDALPLICDLITANLAVISDDWSMGWAPGMSVDFVKPHLGWLHEMLVDMAAGGKFICICRDGDAPRPSVDSPPFANPGESLLLRPHGAPIEVFTYEVRKALRELAADIPWKENDPERRRTWIARWLAAAVLTAHLRLSQSRAPNGRRVPIDAPLGEDPALSAERLISFLETLDPARIKKLPQYLCAAAESMQACVDDIRREFELLQDTPSGSRRRFACEGRIADMLAVCVACPCNDGLGTWPKKLRDRAIRFLAHHQVFASVGEAAEQLSRLGILGNGEVCTRDGEPFERLPNKNSIHQAAMRGREPFLARLAAACKRRGILTQALIQHLTRSEPLRKKLRLIGEDQPTWPDEPSRDSS